MKTIQSLEHANSILKEERAVLVLLKSYNCSVCDAVQVQLTEWLKGRAMLTVLKAQIEDVPEVSGQWTVFTAPNLVLFVDGKEIWRGSRFIRWEELDDVVGCYIDSGKK
ncbi:thioredoxin family protein [Alteribacter populi]|uniref:thioredoxin family protein n=1 Tax=Alteribacter populi TaxID=2011011 RepID=UPI000BBA8E2F|nr:thioredoxin family protein [Alteribacter populi]